jgi:PHD/YefM family antitoxin component YafN of YafNO toxin-antitoxin module
MKIASEEDVKAKLDSYVNAIKKSPVFITRKGKAIAAIVSVLDEDDQERIAMAYNPRLRAILTAAKKRIREGKGIPQDEFWRRMDARYQKHPQKKSA